jgi:hypothetical protein
MTAELLLTQLQFHRFTIRTDGADLFVSPSAKLTDRHRDGLREHKAAVIALLEDRPFTGWCREKGGQWQPIARGSTEREAWQLIHDWIPIVGGQLLEKTVCRDGIHPGNRTAKR